MSVSRLSSKIVSQGLLVFIFLILVLGTALPARGSTSDDSWSLRDIIRELEPGVVWVLAQTDNEWAQGSGFVIHEDGYIITNAHVVEGAKEITVGWADRFDRTDRRAEVVARDLDLDIALLHVPAVHLPSLPVDVEGSASLGDAVIALGFPVGDELGYGSLTVTRGILSSIRSQSLPGVALLQTDAAVTLGCSGGPLYDLDTGTVVGVIQGKGMFLLEGFNFAIPVQDFFELSGTPVERGVRCALAQLAGEEESDFSEPALRALESYRHALLARGQTDWGEALSHFLAATQLENEDPRAAYGAAESYAALDQPRQALRWLERALELGFSDFDGALDSAGFSGYRNDGRFVELVESF